MLEQIIENIIQKIRQEVVLVGMEQVPLAYILTRKMPDSVKHFIDQEVEISIREEREKISSSERFDYEMPEVQILVDKLFDTLKQTANFHLNDFNRLLERAIKLQANYLIRPQQTLTQFLFKDKESITTIEIYDMLKYFDKYQYYKDALSEYFNIKYLREISQNQFRELVRGIDKQVFLDNPVEVLLQTIKTINLFLDEGRPAPAQTISIPMLITIFNDRSLSRFTEVAQKLARQNVKSIPLKDLPQFLRSGDLAASMTTDSVNADFNLESIADLEEEKPAVEVGAIIVPEQMKPPRKESFPEDEFPESDLPPLEDKEEIPEVYDNENRVESAGKRSHSDAEQLANLMGNKNTRQNQPQDLDRLVNPKQKKRFIRKIFKKQENQYRDIVELLNNTPNWKSASNLIDNFFYKQGVNPYSKEALEFSDLIYNRYFPKDSVSGKREEF